MEGVVAGHHFATVTINYLSFWFELRPRKISSCPFVAMTDGAGEWRAAREADIRKAYADKHRWTDLDTVTSQHNYNFQSIENWPLDAALIYKPTDRASVLLGSMKAACGLEDIWKTLSLKVTVVVTMCAHEMKMQGAPKDWTSYFKQHGVFHINCHLEDVTLKPVHRWSERIPALV